MSVRKLPFDLSHVVWIIDKKNQVYNSPRDQLHQLLESDGSIRDDAANVAHFLTGVHGSHVTASSHSEPTLRPS